MHVAHEGHPKEHDAGLYGAIRRFRKPFEWSRPQTRTIIAGLLATAGVVTLGVQGKKVYDDLTYSPTWYDEEQYREMDLPDGLGTDYMVVWNDKP
jgi:hypothetical protein